MSLEAKVSILGCLYLAAALTYLIFRFYQAPGGFPVELYFIVPFVAVFLLAALGVWRKPKAGFVTTIAISAFSLLLVGPNLSIAQSPSLESLLPGGALVNGVFFVTIFFSLFGARRTWGKAPPQGVRPFKLGRSACVGAVVFLLIFVAAGLAYGSTQNVGAVNTGQADIVIAQGAGYLTSNQFYLPQTLNVHVGQTVTWKNLDSIPHTVTGPGSFTSGRIDAGGVYSYTFSQPGTYYYACDYHSWMIGSVVVTS